MHQELNEIASSPEKYKQKISADKIAAVSGILGASATALTGGMMAGLSFAALPTVLTGLTLGAGSLGIVAGIKKIREVSKNGSDSASADYYRISQNSNNVTPLRFSDVRM